MKLMPDAQYTDDPQVIALYDRMNALNEYAPPKPPWANAAKWPFNPTPKIIDVATVHSLDEPPYWVAVAYLDNGFYIASNRPTGSVQYRGYESLLDALRMLVQQLEQVLIEWPADGIDLTRRYRFYRKRVVSAR